MSTVSLPHAKFDCMPKIYRNIDGKVQAVEATMLSYQKIEKNPYKRGFTLVRVRECETDDADCLPLYDLLTVHHEGILTTDEGAMYVVFFTCQNSRESAYLELDADTFPFAYLNYEEHKIWCAEFNEPAPALDAYIKEALFATKEQPKVNCFVIQPNGEVEFFNGIPATEETENRVNELTQETLDAMREEAEALQDSNNYENAIRKMVEILAFQRELYNSLNENWDSDTPEALKLIKQLEKASQQLEKERAKGENADLEKVYNLFEKQSTLFEKIFEVNQKLAEEEEEEAEELSLEELESLKEEASADAENGDYKNAIQKMAKAVAMQRDLYEALNEDWDSDSEEAMEYLEDLEDVMARWAEESGKGKKANPEKAFGLLKEQSDLLEKIFEANEVEPNEEEE